MANKNYPLYDVAKVKTVRDIMNLALRNAKDKVAFKWIEGELVREVSYGEFYDTTSVLGTALAHMGYGKSHIACVGKNSYDWICAYITSLMSEGVFVPVNKELSVEEKINVICESDSEVVFYSSHFEAELMESADSMPNVKLFIGFDRETDAGKFVSYKGLLEKGAALFATGNDTYMNMSSDPRALKMLVYTSGTTGNSKGVMLCEENLVSVVYYGLQVSTVYDVCLSVLPYHHTHEAVANILSSIHHHSTICIKREKPTMTHLTMFAPEYIFVVPMYVERFYKRIWASAAQRGDKLKLSAAIKSSNALRKVGIDRRESMFAKDRAVLGGNLRKIICCGAPIRAKVARFFDDIGIDLINCYGITECASIVSSNRDYFNNPTTAGILFPCCQVKFDNMGAEGNGEICVKGSTVMLGYYKRPDLTSEVLTEDGWFYTGDYGRMNLKGQLIITGRKKNIIALETGKNVYPEEIEAHIQSIPYVEESVVFGIDGEHGEPSTLGAEVYLSADKVAELGIKEPSVQLRHDITRVCVLLPQYKRIKRIFIRQVPFDKNSAKKIIRSSRIYK